MKPKNLYFCFPLKGPINGVKVISSHIYERLKMLPEFKIHLIDSSQAKDFTNFGKFDIKKIRKSLSILKSAFKIRRNELIYLNLTPQGFAFYRDIVFLAISRARGAKATVHIHANGLEKKIAFWNKDILKSTRIIVINSYQGRKLLESGLTSILVPNTLPDQNSEGTLNEVHSAEEPINLLFFSNLSKAKGSSRLPLVVELLNKKGVSFQLTICGGILDTESETVLKTLCSDYPLKVSYLGPIKEKEQMQALFRTSDLFLFLSDPGYEVSPLVYIEAMMFGLPILTTQQEIARTLIAGGCAFPISMNQENEITIPFFDTEYNLNDLKKKCRTYFEEHYSFDDYIKKLAAIIQYQ